MMPYTALAKFYDLLMYDFNYELIIDKVKHEFDLAGKEGIDLCCGTATATLMLSKAGALMTALDLSCEMLNFARDKARKDAQKINFINDDINKFKFNKTYDFICSVCDGFNYILPKNFEAFISASYNSLKKNGILFFDMSTKYKAEKILNGAIHYEDREELCYFYETKTTPKKQYVDMNVTIFEKTEESLYKRYDDNNKQYYYDTVYIMDILKKANFEISIFDGDKLTDYKKDSQRLFMVARKG